MSWLRIDDNMMSHPKIRGLSDYRFRLWIRVLCTCSQHDDPTVDRFVVNEISGLGQAALTEYHNLGLLDQPDPANPHHYRVHNWKLYRPKDPTAAERMRNYRRNANRNDDRNETVTRARDVPDPSRNALQEQEQNPPTQEARPAAHENGNGLAPLDYLSQLEHTEIDS